MERQRSRAERLNKGCDGVSESLGDARHRESESTGNYEEKHSALPLSQPFNFETTIPVTNSFGNYKFHTNQYHRQLLALASRFDHGSNRVEQVHAESFCPGNPLTGSLSLDKVWWFLSTTSWLSSVCPACHLPPRAASRLTEAEPVTLLSAFSTFSAFSVWASLSQNYQPTASAFPRLSIKVTKNEANHCSGPNMWGGQLRIVISLVYFASNWPLMGHSRRAGGTKR